MRTVVSISVRRTRSCWPAEFRLSFSHAKVLEATVAGLPDPKRGETVKAYVVLKQGESCDVEEIRAFCKQNLAPYKVPTLVEFLNELPKSQAGKVLRRVLVEADKKKMAEKG